MSRRDGGPTAPGGLVLRGILAEVGYALALCAFFTALCAIVYAVGR